MPCTVQESKRLRHTTTGGETSRDCPLHEATAPDHQSRKVPCTVQESKRLRRTTTGGETSRDCPLHEASAPDHHKAPRWHSKHPRQYNATPESRPHADPSAHSAKQSPLRNRYSFAPTKVHRRQPPHVTKLVAIAKARLSKSSPVTSRSFFYLIVAGTIPWCSYPNAFAVRLTTLIPLLPSASS